MKTPANSRSAGSGLRQAEPPPASRRRQSGGRPGGGGVRGGRGRGAWGTCRRRWRRRPGGGGPRARRSRGPTGRRGAGPPATPGPAPGGPLDGRERVAPARLDRDADFLGRAQRHPAVSFRGQVQPILAPHARVAEHPHRPQVDQEAVMLAGDGPQVRVEDGGPAADHPDEREQARIESGEDQHPAPGRAQLLDGGVEGLGQQVRVDPGPQQVVAAGGDRDQVRAHGRGRGDLFVQDLGQHLAADGEVGVAQVGLLRGQHLGQPVSPAPAVAAVRPRVPDALGEAVAQRHQRPDRDGPRARGGRPGGGPPGGP